MGGEGECVRVREKDSEGEGVGGRQGVRELVDPQTCRCPGTTPWFGCRGPTLVF